MTDWRASGIEQCTKCRELLTCNIYWFPMIHEGLCVCRKCLGYEKKIRYNAYGMEIEE